LAWITDMLKFSLRERISTTLLFNSISRHRVGHSKSARFCGSCCEVEMSSDEDQMAHPASQMQEQLLTEAAVLRITAEETVGETPVLEVVRETPPPERDVKIDNMMDSAEDTPRVTSQTLPTPAVPAPRVATDEAEVPAKPRKKRHRSKKKDAANTAVLDSRVSQKNTKSQVNDLVTQLEGLSISSRNSTPTRSLGAPSLN